jgi:hypothetical protein
MSAIKNLTWNHNLFFLYSKFFELYDYLDDEHDYIDSPDSDDEAITEKIYINFPDFS